MTPELIIKFARACGLSEDAGTFGAPPGPSEFWSDRHDSITLEDLANFAALVAAHQRELDAKVCEGLTGRSYEFDMGRLHCSAAIRKNRDDR